MIDRLICFWYGGHDYHRAKRAEHYSLVGHKRLYECSRCNKMIRVDDDAESYK